MTTLTTKRGDKEEADGPFVYLVTDIETDGPEPGRNSMLSFASVAVDQAGNVGAGATLTLSPP
ncbi:MAG: hypothetical protein IT563_08520 [Alphaproteobacteria bacterium]|nr:hypothetical protein [Alphaproteobacteria bacterium]